MRFVREEQKLWEYVKNFLVKYDKRYEIKKSNSTITVVYDKEKNLGISYRRKLSEEEMSNLWIFSAIKKQVKSWLKDNRLELIPESFPSVKKGKAYSTLAEGEVFCGTDIKHCYWRMAFNLGYIKPKLYKTLTADDLPPEKQAQYKLLRNKALACLRSKQEIAEWNGEQRIRSYYEGSGEMEQLYNDLRNRCYKIMADLSDKIPDGFIKYKTDCIYYLPQYRNIVEQHLESANMLFKTVDCVKIDSVYFEEDYADIKKM